MIDSHGEDSVTGFFDRYLANEIKRVHGDEAYIVGRWQGNLDKQFGDFFAGVGARNILIEFKKDKDGISSELRDKESRRLLCIKPSDIRDRVSASCHFIGYDTGEGSEGVNFLEYYYRVCSKSKDLNDSEKRQLKDKITQTNHIEFVDKYLQGNLGAYFDDFKKYMDFLLTNWDNNESDSEKWFKATLISYDPVGRLISTKISSYAELKIIAKISPTNIKNEKKNRKGNNRRYPH
ncbi:hypothetical protein L5179_004543 [Vibrio parahaemolyticus]|uniref:hypothetical protein n=1 Tax=Vibrio parahaemolyticus TaxID=670 RepID=UPI00387ABECF|nr:hypothetical protein [Vibrio parahaemolyticus]EIU6761667.1 hypothetical protein [Vibrio parahaemolyticus]EJG1294667.1 hypothetical protein [Vibrio parahaemolyticus]HCG7304623.1 hypothetical protein [Vibrio parahaemolyticus]